MMSKKFKLSKKYQLEVGFLFTGVFLFLPTIGICIEKELFEKRFIISFLTFSFLIIVDKYDYEYDTQKGENNA